MMGSGDHFRGLRPPAPPSELRDRVLQAARLASAETEIDVLARLAADRTLRWCAVALLALALAHAALDGPTLPRIARAAAPVPTVDGLEVPPEGGLTAADQRNIGRSDG